MRPTHDPASDGGRGQTSKACGKSRDEKAAKGEQGGSGVTQFDGWLIYKKKTTLTLPPDIDGPSRVDSHQCNRRCATLGAKNRYFKSPACRTKAGPKSDLKGKITKNHDFPKFEFNTRQKKPTVRRFRIFRWKRWVERGWGAQDHLTNHFEEQGGRGREGQKSQKEPDVCGQIVGSISKKGAWE